MDFNLTQLTIERLLSDKNTGQLKVPEHQRKAGVWNLKQRVAFVDSVKSRMPFPTILIFKDDSNVSWIEDGLQRLTTLEKFKADEFADDKEKKFSEWSDVDRQRFLDYRAPVLIYTGANRKERIRIFDRFQNGSPLKVGERLHSLSDMPLVAFTNKLFFDHTNDAGATVPGLLAESAAKAWGGPPKTGDADKRYGELLNLVALVNGAAHGFNDKGCGITKKWSDLIETLDKDIDEKATLLVLREMFAIYEKASEVGNDALMKRADLKKVLTAQRNAGNFTGPIVYSLKEYPDDWDSLREGWVDVLKRHRTDKNVLDEIHRDLSAARSWNKRRWMIAYKNVFGDDETDVTEEDEEDEDEEDNAANE
jgi:hypothetical protein